jgi:hypothetical protein
MARKDQDSILKQRARQYLSTRIFSAAVCEKMVLDFHLGIS